MSRFQYYEELKNLAHDMRKAYSISTPRVLRSDMRRIYRSHGIRIDLWPYTLRNLRGAYFNDDLGPSVMIRRSLPQDPMIFTLAHELKHHLVDRDAGPSFCDASNQDQAIEIGAEVFAAEMIYPDDDYVAWMTAEGIMRLQCQPEDLVRMKNHTRTTLSYAGLVKKAEFLGYARPGAFSKLKWKKLEEQIFGEPFYKKLLRRQSSYR